MVCPLSEYNATGIKYPMEFTKGTTLEAGDLSLSQMMLSILLTFDTSIDGNSLHVCDGGKIPSLLFQSLAHACLVRIPRIEDGLRILVTSVLEALKNNDDIVMPSGIFNLHKDILILAHDFARFRKFIGIKRHFGFASGKDYFPPDVYCWSLLNKPIIAKENALVSSPFISKLPASRYRSSWDVDSGSVISLFVPNDEFYAFLSRLKSGKLAGFKITYLYSGRMMLIYDLTIAVVAFVSIALCEYGHGVAASKGSAVLSAIMSAGSKITIAIFIGFITKLILWDIQHWFPFIKFWIKSLRTANDTADDNL